MASDGNEITPWPGSRGRLAGPRKRVIVNHDGRYPGYEQFIFNYWLSRMYLDPHAPAARARAFYDDQWVGMACRERFRAMQTQWMSIQMGKYIAGPPAVGGFL